MIKKTLLALSVFILIFAVSCATTTTVETPKISVSGIGTVTLDADFASFQIQVTETAQTTGKAQQLANKKMNQILAIVRSYGVEDKDISTTSLSFSSNYEWDSVLQKSVKVGEQVSQALYVRMKDLDHFTDLVDEIGSTISGISFNSVTFEASDYTQAQIQARSLAYQDAYNKAKAYADAAGLVVGRPLTISDGYSSTNNRIVRNDGLFMKAEGPMTEASYATEAPVGNLNVTVNSEIVFELK